jgi:hypothetical protein
VVRHIEDIFRHLMNREEEFEEFGGEGDFGFI